jgi:hypothetical protein
VKLSVLYRGSLTSCNYACGYCPFAKRTESRAARQRDRDSLTRFVDWIARETAIDWSVLFTPWGEALTRKWYREAISRLSRLRHVESVGVQTNLSCGLNWIQTCEQSRLAFWATFHPSETSIESFLAKAARLHEWGVKLSVGMVGVREHFGDIAELRARLPSDVYLWINAQQPRPRPYSEDETAWLTSIDPHFPLTLRPEASLGRFCRAGERSFTVDAEGAMRRCHFVRQVIGNIDDENWLAALHRRPCPNRRCDCFLGKSQLNAASLEETFGEHVLHRIANPRREAGPEPPPDRLSVPSDPQERLTQRRE